MKPVKFLKRIQEGDELTIAALGDSFTYGWGVTKGYMCCLREMLSEKYPLAKLNLINGGSPGDSARGGMYRVWQDVIRHNPDLVIIQFGLNDLYSGFTTDEFYQNMTRIIKEIQEKTKSEIILVTSTTVESKEQNQIIYTFYDRIVQCGKECKVPVVKIHEFWENRIAMGSSLPFLVQNDGIHPNEAGHLIMAEAIMELF